VTTRSLVPPLAVSLLAALFAAQASAQTPPPQAVTLVPNVAGKPSKLKVDLDEQTIGSSGQQPPRSAVLSVARGFRIDRRARRTRCSEQQARDFACPATSRIAYGQADGNVMGPFLPAEGIDFVISIEAFIARPRQAGDIADVVVQARESRTGRQGSTRGRLVPIASGPFGLELRFDELGEAFEAPPGYNAKLKRFRMAVRGSRTVKRRKRVRRRGRVRRRVVRTRYHFIRNPRTCPGSWSYQVRVTFPDQEVVRDGSVACSSG
jgi:hypothetical protein